MMIGGGCVDPGRFDQTTVAWSYVLRVNSRFHLSDLLRVPINAFETKPRKRQRRRRILV